MATWRRVDQSPLGELRSRMALAGSPTPQHRQHTPQHINLDVAAHADHDPARKSYVDVWLSLRGRRSPWGRRGIRADPNGYAAFAVVVLSHLCQQLAAPSEKLAGRNAVCACHLRDRGLWSRRFRHDPKFIFPAPPPAPLNRRDHPKPSSSCYVDVTTSTIFPAH
jgi:hypothetical protein